jgi:stage V sporulation protein B
MVSLTVAQGAAMFLSFLFYIVAARVLAPHGFGIVRYTITLSEVAFGVLQVLSTSLVRELGAARGCEARTGEVLGTSLVASALLWLVSCGACLACCAAGLTGSADTVGLLVVFSGLTAFTLYWSIGRGVGEVRRMAITYIGGSAVQLAAFVAMVALYRPGPRVALVVFGLSDFVPIIVCEAVRPLIRGRHMKVTRSELRHLWELGRYLLAAQLFYMIWNAADQAWVDNHFGSAQVGFYGAASNLARVFLVLQIGVATVLLPRVAELREQNKDGSARRLVWGSMAAVGLIATALFALIAVGREPLLDVLYGHVYIAAEGALLGLGASMLVYTSFATLTTAAVGWGRPGVYLLGMGCSAAAQLIGFELVGVNGSTQTAWVHAGSICVGMMAVCLRLLQRPLQDRSSSRDARGHVRLRLEQSGPNKVRALGAPFEGGPIREPELAQEG